MIMGEQRMAAYSQGAIGQAELLRQLSGKTTR